MLSCANANPASPARENGVTRTFALPSRVLDDGAASDLPKEGTADADTHHPMETLLSHVKMNRVSGHSVDEVTAKSGIEIQYLLTTFSGFKTKISRRHSAHDPVREGGSIILFVIIICNNAFIFCFQMTNPPPCESHARM